MTLIFAVTISGSASAVSNNASYTIGQNVTQQAYNDVNLGFKHSEKNLVITTAGSAKLKSRTTEKSLGAIIDKTSSLSNSQKITYGNGNLVQLNDPYGTLKYIFVSQAANGDLKAKKFIVISNGTKYTITSTLTVLISANITQTQWNYAKKQLGSDLFSIASIANAWSNDAPIDLLALAQTNKRISTGTISGYVASKAFIKQYPSKSANKEYIVMTVPGGYDDDGFSFLTPWNYRYYAINGTNPLESAYIQWNGTKRTLVLVKFNDNLKTEFKTETGITVVPGTISEIQFNNWLLGFLKNNPGHIITIEKTAIISQTNLDYLIGSSDNNGKVIKPGKGLSEAGRKYILSLNNAKTPFTIKSVLSDDSRYDQYVNLGHEIALKAKYLLTKLKINGVRVTYGNISVSTAPVYATAGGVLINGFHDGFASVVGTDPNNIISLFNPYNSDSYLNHYLNSVFYIKGTNSTGGEALYSVQAQYDPVTNKLTWSNIVNLLPAVKSGVPQGINSTDAGTDRDGNAYFTSGMGAMPWSVMGYLWSKNVSYDIKKAWNCVGHCMSGVQDLALIQSIVQQYPLGTGESYKVIAPTGLNGVQTSRFWGALSNMLGVSVGTGTAYTNPSASDNYGPPSSLIVIKWNQATHTGTAINIQFNFPKDFTDLPEEYTDLLTNTDKNALEKYLSSLSTTKTSIKIDKTGLDQLLASENPSQFMENYNSQTNPTNATTTNTANSTTTSTANSTTTSTANSTTTNTANSTTSTSNSDNQYHLSAADETNSQNVGQEAGQSTQGKTDSGLKGKITEITQVNPLSSTGSSGNPVAIAVGIAFVVLLVGLGFFKGSIIALIKK
jgi:formylmethanofuran dehydrogenase subunit E-like metal-binding protein